MSGPIIRRYGFPNFDQIFGKKEMQHGVDDPAPPAEPPKDDPAPSEKTGAAPNAAQGGSTSGGPTSP